MKFLKVLKFYENFDFFDNFWNFKFLVILKFFENFEHLKVFFLNFKILKFFEHFEILLNFLTLISKKQFLCNKKTYCTLVSRNFIHWFCTRVQYDFLLHRNCFLLINMLENGMSRVLLLANRKTVNRALCNNKFIACWWEKYENLFTQEYHIPWGQRPRGIWYSWVNTFSYFLNPHAINVLLYRMKPRKHIQHVHVKYCWHTYLKSIGTLSQTWIVQMFQGKHRGSQLYFHSENITASPCEGKLKLEVIRVLFTQIVPKAFYR